MPIRDMILGMKSPAKKAPAPAKAKPIKPIKPIKPRTAAQAPDNQTKLGPDQLAVIAAVQGQAEADRIQALLEGGVAPTAIKHLEDVVSPELGYALVDKFLDPVGNPSRKQLEASIADWYLSQQTGGDK